MTDVVNVLFGNFDPNGFTVDGVVEFQADLTISESHDRSGSATNSPVEGGSSISDHVNNNPRELSLTGFLTDTPAALLAADPGRTQQGFDQLDDLWRNRQPTTVVTGRKTYANMVITRLNMPRSRPGSMRFNIDFQQVTIVASQTKQLPDGDSDNTNDRASPDIDVGRQSTRSPDDNTEEEAQGQTDLYRAWNSIRDRAGSWFG